MKSKRGRATRKHNEYDNDDNDEDEYDNDDNDDDGVELKPMSRCQ